MDRRGLAKGTQAQRLLRTHGVQRGSPKRSSTQAKEAAESAELKWPQEGGDWARNARVGRSPARDCQAVKRDEGGGPA